MRLRELDEQHLTQPEIERTVAALTSRHPAFGAHERFITDRLAELAHRCYQHGASNERLSLVGTNAAATQLGVSVAWVRRLAERHNIGWKPDRDRVFTQADIDALRPLIGQKPGPKRTAQPEPSRS